MAAVWMRFRAEFRARWRALLVVALLVGLAGGAVLASLAGARRTDTAYSRLVEKTDAWDVLVNPDLGTDSALEIGDVAVLPQVEQADRVGPHRERRGVGHGHGDSGGRARSGGGRNLDDREPGGVHRGTGRVAPATGGGPAQ